MGRVTEPMPEDTVVVTLTMPLTHEMVNEAIEDGELERDDAESMAEMLARQATEEDADIEEGEIGSVRVTRRGEVAERTVIRPGGDRDDA